MRLKKSLKRRFTEKRKIRNTAMRRVFFMQNNSYHMREYAFVCVYGHIMRANMHIYAKYNIKKFC